MASIASVSTLSTTISNKVPDGRVSLRQADWRFLLSYPPAGSFQHLVLLGAPPGLAERLVETGLTRRVSCEIPEGRSADCVVVLHNAGVALRDAAACLRSGGALYYEVDRRSPSRLVLTPSRMQRALRRLGLTPTGVYWAIPNFAHCKRYVPLDVPEAFLWYLRTLFPAMTPLDRLFEIAVRVLKGLNSHRGLAPLVPCYSVTAVAGPCRNAAPSLLEHPTLPAELKRPDLHPFVLTSGYDDGSRVVMLPFVRDGVQPLAVLKISRLSKFNSHTEREQETLVSLRALLDPTMRLSIPRPLGTLRYGELAVGVESYAAGHSLVVSSGRWRVPLDRKIEDLRLATNWLSDFHQQAEMARLQWGESEFYERVEGSLSAYTRTFGVIASEERLFGEVRKRVRSLAGTSLPIVWQHNDFGPWHLYRAGRAITVIDWEFGHDWQCDRLGPALCDLLYFVTHWSYIVRQLRSDAAQLRGFRELFVEPIRADDEASNAIHAAIADYMVKLGIDQGYFPILLVSTWIQRAIDHFERHRTLGHVATDVRSGNRYVQYLSILADHVERLFAPTART
jgi:aminoglycoside phosphotransferase (APT) family kinase protein